MEVFLPLKYQYLNENKKCQRKHGNEMADVIFRRLEQVRSADCLEDLRNMPGRWHELRGNQKNHISADLRGPLRLIFEPNQPKETYLNGNSLVWNKITKLIVYSIENTHE